MRGRGTHKGIDEQRLDLVGERPYERARSHAEACRDEHAVHDEEGHVEQRKCDTYTFEPGGFIRDLEKDPQPRFLHGMEGSPGGGDLLL